jgi:hypothetical protein
MKGGGFIVFLFLLVCFLWGVTSIVGGIRRSMQSWLRPEPPQAPEPQPAPPRTASRTAGVPAAPRHPPLVFDVTLPAPAAPPNASDSMTTTLASLREASELHRSGVLTDAEFEGIKGRLLKDQKS